MPKKLKTLLSIAGSDPMGGAGIQADIRVGVSMGLHVVTAITAVTSQNSKGLSELGVVSPGILKSQLEAIKSDVIPDSIKIGVIGSIENLLIISDFLKELPKRIPVVIDPLLKASVDKGLLFDNLSNSDIINLYVRHLFPYATAITPNLQEYELITEEIKDWNKKTKVILKGGHSNSYLIEDKLINENQILSSSHPREECKNLHGTGCVFSSSVACYLALGYNLEEAFIRTSDSVYKIIKNSCEYSLGDSTYGPLNINDYIL